MDYSKMTDAELDAALEDKRRQLEERSKKKSTSPYSSLTDEELDNRLEEARRAVARQKGQKGREDLHRNINQFAHNMNVGAAKLADLPFQGYEALRTGLGKAAHYVAPNHVRDTHYGEGYLPNFAERTAKFLDPHQQLAPQTKGQHLAKDIAEAVGTIPALGGVGGILSKAAPRLGNALMAMGAPTASNIGATIAAPTASHAHKELVKNPTVGGQIASGIGGGMAGAYGAPGLLKAAAHIPGAIKNPTQTLERAKDAATRFAGQKLGYMQDVHEKFMRNKLMPTLSQLVESSIPLKAEILASKYPVTQRIFDKIYKHNDKAMAKGVGVINSDDLSKAVQKQDLSKFKSSAQDLKDAVSDRYKALNKDWAPRDVAARGDREQVDIEDILNYLHQKGLGVETPTAKAMHSQTVYGDTLNKLRKMAKEEAAKTQGVGAKDIHIEWLEKNGFLDDPVLREKVLKELEPNPTNIPVEDPTHVAYPELEVIREDLGHKVDKSKYLSREYKQATDVLNKVSDKRHEFIESIGTPEEVKASKLAKRYWTFHKNKESGLYHPASEMLDKPTVENVLDHVISADDPRYFKVLQKGSTPDEHTAIRDAIITEMGKKDGSFRITAAQGQFSKWGQRKQDSFLDFWHTKKEKEAVRDIMDIVGKNKEKIEKIANSSQTAYWTMMLARGGAYVGGAGKILAGNPLPLFGAITADALAYGGGSLLASPKFLNRMHRVMTASTEPQRATAMTHFFRYPPMQEALKKAARASLTNMASKDKEAPRKKR